MLTTIKSLIRQPHQNTQPAAMFQQINRKWHFDPVALAVARSVDLRTWCKAHIIKISKEIEHKNYSLA